jgi:hypothetical protein
VLVLGCIGQLCRCLDNQLKIIGHSGIYTFHEPIEISDFKEPKEQYVRDFSLIFLLIRLPKSRLISLMKTKKRRT